MTPPPPSIDINRQTIARLAVERLWWRMKHGMRSPSVVTTVSPTLNWLGNLGTNEIDSQPSDVQDVPIQQD
jgi:hypothetical protein